MTLRYVGKGVRRVDGADKVTGQAMFVSDITVPRMLHARVVRAGVPHARIISLDTTEAEGMPGVRKVVTGQGCGILFGTCLWDQPPIAVDRVRHAGEPVAVVLAMTEHQADQAARKVKVEYDPLPFQLDPVEAARPGAPLIHERNGSYRRVEYIVRSEAGTNIFHHYKLRKGDAAAGFAAADVILEEHFEFPLSSHCSLEPHGAICRFTQGGDIDMWASNQAPFVVRDVLADMFKIPVTRIRVRVPYLGGGFGGKSDVSIEPLVAYAASQVPGWAVKLVLTRKEAITSSLIGRGMMGRMKIGARKDGAFVALEAEMYFADGAYGDTSWPVVTVAGHNCTGPYEFPSCKVDSYGVYTNSPPVGAFRGYGHPEGQFMLGRMIDLLARKLGIPQGDLMRRNFLCEGRRNGLGQEIKRSHGDLFACLDKVEAAMAGTPLPPEDDRYLYGRGMAAMAKSPKMAANAASTAYLQISNDGSVFVNLAGIEMGQGCQTAFTQIAAEALKVPIERIRMYREVDTQFTPWEWQTVASMQTYRGGRAILQACEKAVELLRLNASLVFDCPVDEVEYDGDACFRKGMPANRLPVASLARGYMFGNGLTVGQPVQATGTYRVNGITEPDPETGMGNAAGSWTFGVQAADVRIEKATGRIDVLHFASCFDPGRVLNPVTIRGQVAGGVVQGLGAALMEKLEFGPDGVIRNANFGPYRIPTIDDMPGKLTIEFVETPNPEGPWSAKPIGEHPIVAVAPTILNAIGNATGTEFTRMPVRAADVLDALRRKEGV
ncbi:MAG: xanthine dehydrogenase family protein molybdopterin-binding subunit [Deltaproteobacteria bacterium]|nr:xanthine dehydrogenase family protein molybdopterin-binding subunit [Deltaproteobacteria bacterium]